MSDQHRGARAVRSRTSDATAAGWLASSVPERTPIGAGRYPPGGSDAIAARRAVNLNVTARRRPAPRAAAGGRPWHRRTSAMVAAEGRSGSVRKNADSAPRAARAPVRKRGRRASRRRTRRPLASARDPLRAGGPARRGRRPSPPALPACPRAAGALCGALLRSSAAYCQ